MAVTGAVQQFASVRKAACYGCYRCCSASSFLSVRLLVTAVTGAVQQVLFCL